MLMYRIINENEDIQQLVIDDSEIPDEVRYDVI